MSVAMTHPVLLVSVSVVDLLRTKKQMVGSNAGRVIASVQNINGVGDLAKCQPPRDAMSQSGQSGRVTDPQEPIAKLMAPTLPFPAARATSVDEPIEPVFKRSGFELPVTLGAVESGSLRYPRRRNFERNTASGARQFDRHSVVTPSGVYHYKKGRV